MSSITIWNRIEPRCRAASLEPGLEARAHDPLWLLTRQWQIGEFAGRDAGSPVLVEVQTTSGPVNRYIIGAGAPQSYDNRFPIEVVIEREAIRPAQSVDDLRQAAEAGLHFLRLLDAANLSPLRSAYLTEYPLGQQNSPDPDSQNLSLIVSGRVVDGIKLYSDLVAAGDKLPSAPVIPDADKDAVFGITRAWMSWYKSLFSEPNNSDAWSPDRMEYQFAAASAGNPGSLIAKEYDGGEVDWYTFNRSSTQLPEAPAQPVKTTRRVLAAPVTFRGMPARRFWELEDASVDIGALTAGADDLGRLLLREFALIYGNDWFQIPLVVPVGSEVSIDSLVVADTFGLKTTISHYTQADSGTGLWQMFSISPDGASGDVTLAQRLVIFPSAVGVIDGSPIEDVLLLRDELADMVWGVERTAVGTCGLPIDRTLIWRTTAPPIQPPHVDATPRYRLGSTVPDYWIPFLPVGPNNTHLQLQRARLPGPATSTDPLGRILRSLDTPIFLDEVPREGVHLERRYRYARSFDGSTCLWIGRRRSTGRGEGRSGLQFDYLEV